MHTASSFYKDPRRYSGVDCNITNTSGFQPKLSDAFMMSNSREYMTKSRELLISASPLPVHSQQVLGSAMNRTNVLPSTQNLYQNTPHHNRFLSSDGMLGYMVPHPGYLVPTRVANHIASPPVYGELQSVTEHHNEFPSSFDPRNAPNMPHKEKVNEWISEVPIYPIVRDESAPLWHSECYPGVVSSSSSNSKEDDDYLQCDLEDQYWGLNTSYNESTMSVSGFRFGLFVDHEDMLEYQSRKITRYVKKLYQQDTSERVVQGEKLPPQVLNRHFKDYKSNDSSPADVSQANFTLKMSEAFLDDELYDMCHSIPPLLPERKKRTFK